MANRDYLADEITMVQSDNEVLKHENELLKMTSERKAEENRILKEDLVSLRALYSDKVDEAASLRTILESIGHNVSAGLTRFMERRQVKLDHRDRDASTQTEAKTAVVVAYREEQRADQGAVAYAPPKTRAAAAAAVAEPSPRFLRPGAVRGDIQNHALIPRAGDSGEEFADRARDAVS